MNYLWNRLVTLDKILRGLAKLMAQLETLAARRRQEIDAIEASIKSMQSDAESKAAEADRAERIKDRFQALIQ